MRRFHPRFLIQTILMTGLLSSVPLRHPYAAERPKSEVPMTRVEELLAVHDNMGSKASFVELDPGRILMSEGSRFRTSNDGGLTWSTPWEGKDPDGKRVAQGESSLVKLSGAAIGLATRYWFEGEPGKSSGAVAFFRSDDGGKSWSKPVRVSLPVPFTVAMLHDTVIRTTSGRIIFPVYTALKYSGAEGLKSSLSYYRPLTKLIDNQVVRTAGHFADPSFGWCYVYYSDDDGKTWQTNRGGQLYIFNDGPEKGWFPTYEPSVAEVEPGKLLMLVRTPNLGRLFKTWSFDNGMTWTALAATQLATTTSPCQIRKIAATGDLLVVWTQISHEEMRKGLTGVRLSSAISRTNGSVWEFYQNIESSVEGSFVEPGPIRLSMPEGSSAVDPVGAASERDPLYVVNNHLPAPYGEFSYPSVFVAGDKVVVSYRFQSVAGDPARIGRSGLISTGGRLKVLPLSWFYAGRENIKAVPHLKYLSNLENSRP